MWKRGRVIPKDDAVEKCVSAHLQRLTNILQRLPESNGFVHCPYCDEPFDRTDLTRLIPASYVFRGIVPGHPNCQIMVKPLNTLRYWKKEMAKEIVEVASPFFCKGFCYCPSCDEPFLPGPDLLRGEIGDGHQGCSIHQEQFTLLDKLLEVRANSLQKAS